MRPQPLTLLSKKRQRTGQQHSIVRRLRPPSSAEGSLALQDPPADRRRRSSHVRPVSSSPCVETSARRLLSPSCEISGAEAYMKICGQRSTNLFCNKSIFFQRNWSPFPCTGSRPFFVNMEVISAIHDDVRLIRRN